jgi:hypothetical protein
MGHMTKENIIRMAREAGATSPVTATIMLADESVIRFAALVAAAEREACRTIAADYAQRNNSLTAVNIADAIRARGQA